MAEGALALFNSSYFGAFTRTYYPADVIAALNGFWSNHADVLAPRSKLQLIAAQLARRNYAGRVYARAHNVRPTYIQAYDTALADVDVLIMPTTLTPAPKVETTEGGYLDVLEDSLRTSWWPLAYNTAPFNYTGHPALATPVGKSAARLPVSMQLVGHMFDDALLLRMAYAYQHSVDWEDKIRIGD